MYFKNYAMKTLNLNWLTDGIVDVTIQERKKSQLASIGACLTLLDTYGLGTGKI